MNSQIHALYPMRAIQMVSGTSTPVASQAFTVSSSAVGVTTPFTYPLVKIVTFDVQSANVYVRWDGTDPTAAAGGGHLLVSGSAYTWDATQFNSAKFIRSASTDAVIFCSAMTC